jgi:hypothetical protein
MFRKGDQFAESGFIVLSHLCINAIAIDRFLECALPDSCEMDDGDHGHPDTLGR